MLAKDWNGGWSSGDRDFSNIWNSDSLVIDFSNSDSLVIEIFQYLKLRSSEIDFSKLRLFGGVNWPEFENRRIKKILDNEKHWNLERNWFWKRWSVWCRRCRRIRRTKEAGEDVQELANAVENEVDDLLADGVVATGADFEEAAQKRPAKMTRSLRMRLRTRSMISLLMV